MVVWRVGTRLGEGTLWSQQTPGSENCHRYLQNVDESGEDEPAVDLVQAPGAASDPNSLSDPGQVPPALWPSVFTLVEGG